MRGLFLLAPEWGDSLGLYTALKQQGPISAAELANATNLHERWVREWLHQQARGHEGHACTCDAGPPSGAWRPRPAPSDYPPADVQTAARFISCDPTATANVLVNEDGPDASPSYAAGIAAGEFKGKDDP